MAISDWGLIVAMPTPGLGVVLHYVEDYGEYEPVVWMRAACGLEAEGAILDWFDHLPRNTKTCDYCFVSLPPAGLSTEAVRVAFRALPRQSSPRPEAPARRRLWNPAP